MHVEVVAFAVTACVGEERFPVVFAGFEVIFQPFYTAIRKENEAGFAPFTSHHELFALEVHLFPVEVGEFAHAQAGGKQRL